MSASLKANEPSMEEILASIRRIIADDGGSPAAHPSPEPEPESAVDEDLDVLDLATVPPAEPLIKPVDLEPLPQSVDMDEDIEFRVVDDEPPPAPKPAPAPRPVAPPPPPPSPAPVAEVEELDDGLLSPAVGAHVASAFQGLSAMLVPQSARTLEDLVKEMLRPMLKGWLDENLPDIVERLVKAEIERVARGPRS
ncbi:MAG: DUF2497 domain-containing protein [Alsobacter sp.]